MKRALNNRPNETVLAKNQEIAVKSEGFKRYIQYFRSKFHNETDPLGQTNFWLNQPNIKKQERLSTAAKLRTRAKDAFSSVYESRTYTDFKGKPGEVLPIGKPTRAIGELGKAAAFSMGPFVSRAKHIMAEPYFYKGGVCLFIEGPRNDELERVTYWLNSKYKVVWIYFSDDSVISVLENGKRRFFEGDYSNADGSTLHPVMNATIDMLSANATIRKKISDSYDCLRKPLRAYNRAAKNYNVKGKNKYDYVQFNLKPNKLQLYSGSDETTLLNNKNQKLCFHRTMDLIHRRKIVNADQMIVQGCFNAGFIMTMTEVKTVSQLKFLKHLFPMADGVYVPIVHPGCYFPKFGTIKATTHLPSFKVGSRKATTKERFDAFYAELVYSREGWGNHCIQDAFRDVFPPSMRVAGYDKVIKVEENSYRTQVDSVARITDEELANALNVSLSELIDMCDLIRSDLKYGSHLTHPLINDLCVRAHGFARCQNLPKRRVQVKLANLDGEYVADVGA
jgi:hypothetical protein